MAKVIVERPRFRGGRGPQGGRGKTRVRAAIEDAPLYAGMRPREGGRKQFNENLAPLRRYLLAQVGRPWDRVYAEICAHIKLSSAIQRHVLEHLEQMVVRAVDMVGKQPTTRPDGRPLYASRWHGCVYVHPDTGLLRRVPPRPRPVRVLARDRYDLGDGHQLQRVGKVWYHVSLAPIPELPTERRRTVDAVLGLRLEPYYAARRELQAQHGRDDVYAASKRQIGRRDLERLLPDDPR